MPYKVNPHTGELDYYKFTQAELEALFLKLDQSTPQTVDNGVPIFNQGARFNGAIILKSGQKLIFDGV